MKSQRLDHDASRSLQRPVGSNPISGQASETSIVGVVQRLHGKLQQRIPRQSSYIEHRLNWFIGLYFASLLSFSGLVSAVRWTLELL